MARFPYVLIEIISNFHPLEVVIRGRETQLQVGTKLNYKRVVYGISQQSSMLHISYNYFPKGLGL